MEQAPLRVTWRDHMQSVWRRATRDLSLPPNTVSIDIVRAEIHSFEEDLALCQKILNLKRALISPSHQHPLLPEILSMIFLTCRNENLMDIVAISHVCTLWRRIALNHRGLWNHIDLGGHEHSFERVRAWLERSHPLPVKFTLSGCNVIMRGELSGLLLGSSERWESITIQLEEGDEATNLQRLLPGEWKFPRLKELRILDYVCESLDLQFIAAILRNNTGLSTLSISGSTFDAAGWPEHELFDFQQCTTYLTHLTLGESVPIEATEPMPVDIVLGLLSACPNLKFLECHHTQNPDLPSSPTVLSLPLLRELSLGDGHKTCVLLRFLKVPQLRSLRIFHPHVRTENSTTSKSYPYYTYIAFTDLFRTCLESLRINCSPPLTSFILEGSSRHLREIFPVFKVFRAIENLEFRALDIVDTSTLSELLLDYDSQLTLRWLAPNLRTLKFSDCGSVDIERLSAILTARNNANTDPDDLVLPARIKSVRVEGCPTISGDVGGQYYEIDTTSEGGTFH